MKKMLLALVLAVPMMAQTPDYVLPSPFQGCDVGYTHLFTVYQACYGGATFVNPQDGTTLVLHWRNFLNFYVVQNGVVIKGTVKTKVNFDVAPTANTPGSSQVVFQIQTADGMYHVGLWTQTWTAEPDFRIGQHPEMETGDVQMDVSTVAILD